MPYSSANIIEWIGRRLEKKAFERSKVHMDKAVEALLSLQKAVYAYFEQKIDELYRYASETTITEEEADDIKRKIIDDMSKGAFHPIDRDMLIRLIFSIDDIATYAKTIAKRLELLPELSRGVDKELADGFKEFANRLVHITKETNTLVSLLIEDPKKAVEHSHVVEKIEDEIDSFRIALLQKMLRAGEELGFVRLTLLKEISDAMEEIADRCEDVADAVRSIAVSYI